MFEKNLDLSRFDGPTQVEYQNSFRIIFPSLKLTISKEFFKLFFRAAAAAAERQNHLNNQHLQRTNKSQGTIFSQKHLDN